MTIEGIDVSAWQGQPNWNAIAKSDIRFGFAKATEGVGFVDGSWAYNAKALVAPGSIIPGAYHFARPDLGNSPEAEANWFWSVVVSHVADLKGWLLVLDIEVAYNGSLANWRDRFCAQLSRLAGGYSPGWYSYHNYVITHALNYATNYWGWFAWPDSNGPLPDMNFSVAMQQYGLRNIAGLGGVDANRFFGDTTQLGKLAVGGTSSTTPGIPDIPSVYSGGFIMGASMGGFLLDGIDHTFEMSSSGDILWGRSGGGSGGQVHVGFWNLGGSGPGKPVDFSAWPTTGGPNNSAIIIRTKYAMGNVMQKVIDAQTLDEDHATVFEWFQPDNAGPFGVVQIKGDKGDKGDPGSVPPHDHTFTGTTNQNSVITVAANNTGDITEG